MNAEPSTVQAADQARGTPVPLISVVIPLHVKGERFLRALDAILHLDYPLFEVVIVVDDAGDVHVPKDPRIRLLETKQERTGPAEKRDFALAQTSGAILAFIDDDSYPRRDWLANAVKYFGDSSVGIIGGPGLTPPENSFWQQVSGAVLESAWGSGPLVCRFSPHPLREVPEHPGYNLFIRRTLLEGVSGFGSKFYGGEDTLVCFKVARRYGKKILCVPDVVVYHHRRPLLRPYLVQTANFGRHRGYFFKRYPHTSRHIVYLMPSCLTLGLAGGAVMAVFIPSAVRIVGGLTFALAAFMIASELKKGRPLLVAAFFPIAVLLTHVAYGLSFLWGLCTPRMER